MSTDRSDPPTGTAPSDALTHKATAAVLNALSEGPRTRADLVRWMGHHLQGDADANRIIGLVLADDFHRAKPWVYDGWRAALPQHEDRLRQMRKADRTAVMGRDVDTWIDRVWWWAGLILLIVAVTRMCG